MTNFPSKLAMRPLRVLVFIPASALTDKTNPLAQYADQVMNGSVATEYRPDCLIFDLEDSVSSSHKAKAADILADYLNDSDKPNAVQIALRVNCSGGRDQRYRELALASREVVGMIMVPKIDSDNFQEIVHDFGSLGKPLLPIIETAAAFNDQKQILQALRREAQGPRDFAAVLGLDDLAADLRIARNTFFEDAAYRSMLGLFVSATRQADLAAIGPVYNVARDPAGAAEEARQLSRLGFQGTLCVFPPYVRVIKESFTPTIDAEQRAIAIRAELTQAGGVGFGWVIHDGIKYDTADLSYLDWLIAHAAACRSLDSC